jgi:hypothetical protein
MPVCAKCGVEWDELSFRLHKGRKGIPYREHQCKECAKLYSARYFLVNRERLYEKLRKDKAENPDKHRATKKRSYAKQRDRWRKYGREYGKANCPRRNVTRKAYHVVKMSDPIYRLQHTLRGRLHTAFTFQGTKKNCKSLELVGCSLPELKAHLEGMFRGGMSWENAGSVWHIDHIRPVASFDLLDLDQQKLCFHYSNLQPLLAAENLAKGCSMQPIGG